MNKLKVIIAGLFVACLGIGVASAQTTPSSTTSTTKTSSGTTAKSGQHLKKDGTPDKRYKENKTAKTSTGTKKAAAKTAAPASGTTTGK